MVAMVARLQDENRKLSSSLAKTEGTLIHSNGEGGRGMDGWRKGKWREGLDEGERGEVEEGEKEER